MKFEKIGTWFAYILFGLAFAFLVVCLFFPSQGSFCVINAVLCASAGECMLILKTLPDS